MRLWLILVQADDHTWLEAAWDDESTAENPRGWQEEVARVRELAHKNDYEVRICSVRIPGLHDLFDIPEIEGELEDPRS